MAGLAADSHLLGRDDATVLEALNGPEQVARKGVTIAGLRGPARRDGDHHVRFDLLAERLQHRIGEHDGAACEHISRTLARISDKWSMLVVRVLGLAPPRLERLIPGLHYNALASFLAYFVLYDFAAYWVHRAQHRFGWWWALHSLHHSQRRVTAWTDDRNHILDDLLVNLVLAVFAQFVGVQPDDFVLILIVGRLVESFSHVGIDLGFGRLGARLLVAPRFHRLHHARADAREPHIHDHNFAPVFPVWDMLFGTARFDAAPRPTGVDNAEVDRDNGRGWLAQQVRVFRRFVAALTPLKLGAPPSRGAS